MLRSGLLFANLFSLSLLLAAGPPLLAQDEEPEWDESELDESDSEDDEESDSFMDDEDVDSDDAALDADPASEATAAVAGGEPSNGDSPDAAAAAADSGSAPGDTRCGAPPPDVDPKDLACIDVGTQPPNGRSFKWVNQGEGREKRGANCVYRSLVSGHLYDPRLGDPPSGIPPGTPFENLPEDWTDPDSGASKADFEPMCD